MSFPPRLVSILVPIQWLLVFLGYCITRKVVNFATGSDPNSYLGAFMPLMIKWASEAGWVLFLVPLVWGLHATLCADCEAGYAELQPRDARIGLGLTLLIGGVSFFFIMFTLGWALMSHGPLMAIDQ